MKKRIITAIGYVLVIAGCYCAKLFLPKGYGVYFFDVLFWAVSLIGTFEYLRAVKTVSPMQRAVAWMAAMFAVPVYVATRDVNTLLYTGAMAFMLYLLSAVFDYRHSTLQSTALALLGTLYVVGLSSVCVVVNHLPVHSETAMLVLFVSVPLTDCMALFTGMAFGKKLPYKLAPDVSPNKTIVGAVGGLIGGMAGAMACYGVGLLLNDPLSWVFMLLLGVCVSLFCQLGDLFESAVKRQCGIKDMGKLLPGHGGILDRFDGTLFAGVVILLFFALL